MSDFGSHSSPDNQKGYRTDAEIAVDSARDPLPRLRAHLVPAFMSDKEWAALEAEVARDVDAGLQAARARPAPDPASVKRFVYAEEQRAGEAEPCGGLSAAERAAERITEPGASPGESEQTNGAQTGEVCVP